MEAKNYSNPRMEATINDWPFGSKRATAYFKIEQHPSGTKERGTRFLILGGKQFATKKLTFARKARIVDGSDGRTYILELNQYSYNISVMRGDMKSSEESISDTDSRFEGLKRLFDYNAWRHA